MHNRGASVAALRELFAFGPECRSRSLRNQCSPSPESAIGVSAATIYTWKSKYGGMDVSDAQRLKGLEDENRRLKHLVADLSLDKEVLKAVIQKNGWSLPA
jgi:putative transposase